MNATNNIDPSVEDLPEYRILQRPPSPSVVKNFYLIVFVYTMGSALYSGLSPAFSSLFGKLKISYGSTGIVFSTENILNGMFLIIICLAGTVFFFHMLRLYASVETLEDPFSPLHRNYLCKIDATSKWKVSEQLIRAVLFAVVSAKGFFLIYNHNLNHNNTLNPLSSLAIFSWILYFVMMVWDFVMVLATAKAADMGNRIQLKQTFFWRSSLPGFVVSPLILGVDSLGPHELKSTILAVLACVYFVPVTWSLFWGDPRLSIILRHLWQDFSALGRAPYCGYCAKSNHSYNAVRNGDACRAPTTANIGNASSKCDDGSLDAQQTPQTP